MCDRSEADEMADNRETFVINVISRSYVVITRSFLQQLQEIAMKSVHECEIIICLIFSGSPMF